mgnify:CR=1 FL=1
MEKEGNNLFQVNLKGMIALLSEHIYSCLLYTSDAADE